MDFTKAMQFVGQWEWLNRADGMLHTDPNDPGGTTKYGIAQKEHPELDVASLTLAGALAIYKSQYWDAAGCDNLADGLDMAVMDTAVNNGVGRAKQFLAKATDVRSYLELRRQFDIGLNNPKELQGWLNRINDLSKFIAINVEPPVAAPVSAPVQNQPSLLQDAADGINRLENLFTGDSGTS